MNNRVAEYINGIGDPHKRAFAEAYAAHLRGERPEPRKPKRLPAKDAVAVRINLHVRDAGADLPGPEDTPAITKEAGRGSRR